MLAKVLSCAVIGVEGFPVTVEVDATGGIPSFDIVGLPDAAVRESRDRARSALANSGWAVPNNRHITINLAPADLRKEGASFDLPITLGVMLATEQLNPSCLDGYMVSGELSLGGSLSRVRGALSMALAAVNLGCRGIIIPAENAAEAAVVTGIQVVPVSSLSEAIRFLNNELDLEQLMSSVSRQPVAESVPEDDFADVKGQEHAKRALEVAAAGGHNLIMIGPPGSGKTMLAQRLSTIMPPLSLPESIELTRIYSAAGQLGPGVSLITVRPFRSPHHTASYAGLIGGGRVPRPGEVSLAHQGVLFLDELPEFEREVLEVLRQPLEDGVVSISRAALSLTYPSRFMLVAAMNPCPCGYFGDTQRSCICTPMQVHRYRSRISGPLLDRIDLHVQVPRLRQEDLNDAGTGDSSVSIRERVVAARNVQTRRFEGRHVSCNAAMGSRELRDFCVIDPATRELLTRAMNQFGLSARAYSRTLKLARTIADLVGEENMRREHVAEAIQYRVLDRAVW